MRTQKFYPYRFTQVSRVSKQCITSAMIATVILLLGFVIEEYRREQKYAQFESQMYRRYDKIPTLETLIEPCDEEELLYSKPLEIWNLNQRESSQG